jgi:hypothetical protein
MGRLLAALVLAPALAGCVAVNGNEGSVIDPMDPVPKTYDNTGPGTMSKVGEAVLSVPETVVWWPYKIASSTLRGGYDGVVGGVGKAPVPALGVLLSPVTAAAGVVNGTVKGVGRGPHYIGTTGEFGESLSKPWTEPIPLWKEPRNHRKPR